MAFMKAPKKPKTTPPFYYCVEFRSAKMIESPVELQYYEITSKAYETLEFDDFEVVEVMETDKDGWVQSWLKTPNDVEIEELAKHELSSLVNAYTNSKARR